MLPGDSASCVRLSLSGPYQTRLVEGWFVDQTTDAELLSARSIVGPLVICIACPAAFPARAKETRTALATNTTILVFEEAYPALQERSTESNQNANGAPQTQIPTPQPNPEPTNPPVASNVASNPPNTGNQHEAELPQTGSLLPLVGFMGFTLLAVGVALRLVLRAWPMAQNRLASVD